MQGGEGGGRHSLMCFENASIPLGRAIFLKEVCTSLLCEKGVCACCVCVCVCVCYVLCVCVCVVCCVCVCILVST